MNVSVVMSYSINQYRRGFVGMEHTCDNRLTIWNVCIDDVEENYMGLLTIIRLTHWNGIVNRNRHSVNYLECMH